MESINRELENLGDQAPTSEKQDSSQGVQLATKAVSPTRGPKGGGPRTLDGKRRTRSNAARHAIFSQVTLLEGEPRAEFELLLRRLRNHLKPYGPLEELLVDKIASLSWRYRRFLLAEGERNKKKPLDFDVNSASPLSFDLLLRYESSLDRAFDRVLSQLQQLQGIRRGQPALPTIDVRLDVP